MTDAWQPVETAPKNEAVLIAGGDVLYPIVASLNKTKDRESWDLDVQGAILAEEIADAPTHWMPLPEAPND